MSASHERFTYPDAHGVMIHAQRWLPDGASLSHATSSPADTAAAGAAAQDEPALGVVQLVHGVGEHSDRYAHFARELAAAGFLVYAADNRGHGRTGLEQHGDNPAKIGKLGKGGLRATEDAITQLTTHIRTQYPDLPVAVFAHSWGSLMAQRILQRVPELWDAVILSGSAYRTPKHMHAGDLNHGFGEPFGYDWLSRDPAVAAAMEADPRTAPVNVLKSFGPAQAAKLFGTPKAPLAAGVPILIISGAADPLNKNNGLELLAADYRRAGVRDVALKLYPEARHELINELNRDEVVADILTWLTDRLLESEIA